jgi:hypothetical protein
MSTIKGPWQYKATPGDCWTVHDCEGTAIMGAAQYYPWVPVEADQWRLIAAAPELLESLVDLVALYPMDSTDAIITSARAAIAKATGETT